jgi:catalase
MAKRVKARTSPRASKVAPKNLTTGNGGETHQVALEAAQSLTTNQGIRISDNQNSLRGGDRGPTLLEDFVLREKITHFDHERIPERIVHARGSGAHGYFQPTKSLSHLTKAAFPPAASCATDVETNFVALHVATADSTAATTATAPYDAIDPFLLMIID